MLNLAGGDDLVLDLGGQVDRDGEGYALVTTGAAVDLRVDTHHLAACVEQRATGVAGVHRHVGLDEGHGAVVGQAAALGADDAGGHGVLEAEGRTDGQHPFAHAQITHLAHGDHGQVLAFHLEHGHVGLGIGAQHLGLQFAAVGELDGHFLGALHHMGVGQDDAVRADDEARALAAGLHIRRLASALATTLAGHALHAGDAEAAQEFLDLLGVHTTLCQGAFAFRCAGRADHADVHHGRAVALGDGREIGRAVHAGQGRGHRGGGGRGMGRGHQRRGRIGAQGGNGGDAGTTHHPCGHQCQGDTGTGQGLRFHGSAPIDGNKGRDAPMIESPA